MPDIRYPLAMYSGMPSTQNHRHGTLLTSWWMYSYIYQSIQSWRSRKLPQIRNVLESFSLSPRILGTRDHAQVERIRLPLVTTRTAKDQDFRSRIHIRTLDSGIRKDPCDFLDEFIMCFSSHDSSTSHAIIPATINATNDIFILPNCPIRWFSWLLLRTPCASKRSGSTSNLI